MMSGRDVCKWKRGRRRVGYAGIYTDG